jgi:hypothetical protein
MSFVFHSVVLASNEYGYALFHNFILEIDRRMIEDFDVEFDSVLYASLQFSCDLHCRFEPFLGRQLFGDA